jgi:hypothetical protein
MQGRYRGGFEGPFSFCFCTHFGVWRMKSQRRRILDSQKSRLTLFYVLPFHAGDDAAVAAAARLVV